MADSDVIKLRDARRRRARSTDEELDRVDAEFARVAQLLAEALRELRELREHRTAQSRASARMAETVRGGGEVA